MTVCNAHDANVMKLIWVKCYGCNTNETEKADNVKLLNPLSSCL